MRSEPENMKIECSSHESLARSQGQAKHTLALTELLTKSKRYLAHSQLCVKYKLWPVINYLILRRCCASPGAVWTWLGTGLDVDLQQNDDDILWRHRLWSDQCCVPCPAIRKVDSTHNVIASTFLFWVITQIYEQMIIHRITRFQENLSIPISSELAL